MPVQRFIRVNRSSSMTEVALLSLLLLAVMVLIYLAIVLMPEPVYLIAPAFVLLAVAAYFSLFYQREPTRDERISEFLDATFQAIDQGVVIYDSDLKLVSWNERYYDVGVDPAYITYGADLLEMYHVASKDGLFGPGNPEEIAQRHIDAILEGPMIDTELLTSPDGLRFRANRFRLSNGGIVVTFRNVTDELRVEEQLRQAQKMEAIGQLAGGVAHDFNNILMVILGHSELLLETARTESEKETVQPIVDAAMRGGDVTHRLLAFSRKQSLQPQTTELGPMLDSLSVLLQRTLGERIALHTVVPHELWFCLIDQVQLETSIINLAINARDAMPGGGSLVVRCDNQHLGTARASSLDLVAGDYVTIAVEDTGTGMEKDVVSRAIEPFFSTKQVGQGTGLGLPMVYGFVKQSDGAVHIESTVGEGTTVTLYLPRSEEKTEVRERYTPLSTESGDGTVLVVEDETDIRSVLAQQIKQLGYGVVTAVDVDDAKRLVASDQDINIVLSDIVLPGSSSGWDLAKWISNSEGHLRCILMSGYSEKTLAPQHVPDDQPLLMKPFTYEQLRRALSKPASS
ncbi:MAG: ATP-binding protein [Pseudomonadota bacterium]